MTTYVDTRTATLVLAESRQPEPARTKRAYKPCGAPYEHGSRATYKSGCRCGGCKRANATYERDRRERALARSLLVIPGVEIRYTAQWDWRSARRGTCVDWRLR